MSSDPVRWLYDLQHFGVKLGLANIRSLLGLLDRPESAFPSVLVGGTNGKGSVAAMLAAMLDASGIRSGLFTSPHLVRPNERVRIAGNDISDAELDRQLRAVRARIEHALENGDIETHPSFFETLAGTALAAMKDAGVDAAVLEVGLGGRLDATNAVDSRASVIVTVELDHTVTLGETIERIATEKGGIIKSGRPLVTGVTQPEVLSVLRQICRERGSRLIEARRAATLAQHTDGSFGLRTATRHYADLRLPLSGAHQYQNARVAVVAFETLLETLGIKPDPALVRRGLASVRWAGRLQWIDGDPPLLLDGAHNPAAAEALADYLRRRKSSTPPVLLFGAMGGKDVPGILAPLAGLVGSVVVTRPDVGRAAEPEDLARASAQVLGPAEVVPQPAEALTRARTLARNGGFVLVAGSLYLVGEVLGLLEPNPAPGPVAM